MSDQQSRDQPPQLARGVQALKDHIILNKIDTALWASRVLTILFTIGYVIPIFG